MKPDSELQEALDEFQIAFEERHAAGNERSAKRCTTARQSIESLFERRIAELEAENADLEATSAYAARKVQEYIQRISLLEANALTWWQIEEILGGPPESGRPGYLQHHPDCVPPSDCQCNLFGIQNRLRGIANSSAPSPF